MRIILIILSAIFCSPTLAQIVYDSTVHIPYEKLLDNLPIRMRKDRDADTRVGYQAQGRAIFTQFDSDTLNRELLRPAVQEVVLIDTKTNRPFKPVHKKSEYITVDCYGVVSKDTLFIEISTLRNDQSLIAIVTKQSALAYYSEHSKYDSVYKVNVTDSLKTFLEVPAKIIGLTLNQRHYKVGKTVYGMIEVITNRFFIKDQWEENHFYQLRWKFKCFFKVKLSAPEKVNTSKPYYNK